MLRKILETFAVKLKQSCSGITLSCPLLAFYPTLDVFNSSQKIFITQQRRPFWRLTFWYFFQYKFFYKFIVLFRVRVESLFYYSAFIPHCFRWLSVAVPILMTEVFVGIKRVPHILTSTFVLRIIFPVVVCINFSFIKT